MITHRAVRTSNQHQFGGKGLARVPVPTKEAFRRRRKGGLASPEEPNGARRSGGKLTLTK